MNSLGLPISSSPWFITRTLLSQQLSLLCAKTLGFKGKSSLLFPSEIGMHKPCIPHPEHQQLVSELLIENTKLAFIVHVNEFLTVGSWEDDISFPLNYGHRDTTWWGWRTGSHMPIANH